LNTLLKRADLSQSSLEMESIRSLSVNKEGALHCLRFNWLMIATLGGVLVGLALGLVLKASSDEPWSQRDAMYVKFIGELFLQMLKGIIIPLIVPALIASIGSLSTKVAGKVGLRAIVYYLTTTIFAVVLGITLVLTIKPGVGKEGDKAPSGERRNVTTPDTMMDLIRNCIPVNVVGATIQQARTELEWPDKISTSDTGAIINPADKTTWKFDTVMVENTNILGLVTFSIVLGVAIAITSSPNYSDSEYGPRPGLPVLRFFRSLTVVMMKLTTWIIYLTPVGVCFLIAGQILATKDLSSELAKLGMYFITVMIGLLVHGFIVLPVIYFAVTRSNPFIFIFNMGSALITAFGTGSSSATLPVTINCIEEKNRVSQQIARFVLPIGAVINMDGTGLYEAVAAIFIAQLNGIQLNFGQVVTTAITATAASIGAAGIPQAGLVTMVMVLETVGLPSEAVATILSVDWLLDRFRTAINVLGDSLGAGLVAHLSRKEIELAREEEEDDKSARAEKLRH